MDSSEIQATDLSHNAVTQDSELIEQNIIRNLEVPQNDIELKQKKKLSSVFKITTKEDINRKKCHEEDSQSEDDREFKEKNLTNKIKIGWKQKNK